MLSYVRNKNRKSFAKLLFSAIAVGVICLGWYNIRPVFAQFVDAQSIQRIGLSASLFNSENRIITNGTYEVRFAIYSKDRAESDVYPSNADAGSRLWEETQTVSVKNGVFRVFLGSANPLPESLTFNEGDYYVGMRIGTDSEMVPRKRLGSVPRAINSQYLGGKQVGTGAGDILTLGNKGKIDIKQLPTGTGSKQLVLGNDSRLQDSHQQNSDIGTDSTVFTIGDGASLADNFLLNVSSASNTPAIRFNGSTGAWQFSNDGTTFADISSGSSGTYLPLAGGTMTGAIVFAPAQSFADLISLGADTVGNYLASVSGGNGIVVSGSGSEGATPTVSLSLLGSADGTGAASSNSGLEFQGVGLSELTLLQGCSNGQGLSWNDTTNVWECTSFSAGLAGSGTAGYATYWSGASSLGSEQYLSSVRGGTGLDASAASNGSLLIGNGSGFTLNTLAGSGGVTVTNAVGIITLGLDALTSGTTATTYSNSGLETTADGIRLLGGCNDEQVLAWNATLERWVCSNKTGGTSDWTSTGSYTYLTDATDDLVIGGATTDAGFFFDVSAGTLAFEGTTADTYETAIGVIDPTADNTINFPNVSGTVITTGNLSSITATGTIASGTWNGTTIDVAHGGTGAATLSDLITLGTHTVGSYVSTIAAGNGISTTGASSGETIAHTLSLKLLILADSTGGTSSNSGLEFQGVGSDSLALLQGCSNGQVLSWNETTSVWECNSVSGMGGVTGSATSGQVAYWDSSSSIAGENQLAVSRGGTGIGSYTIGDLLYASGATTLSRLADVATGNVLISGGLGIAPSWGKVDLTSHVTGTLPVANGGTGATSLNDLITLSTHTTGNYVASVSNGSGITGGSAGSEGAALTLAIDLLDSADGTGSTSSNSGLEFQGAGSNELTLIQGCSNNQMLLWNDTTSTWYCGSVSGAGGIDGTGTAGYSAYWTDVDTLANEQYVSVARGGTGLSGSTAANGTLLIGTGTGYALATLTQGAGMTITNGSGTISLATTLGASVDLATEITGTLPIGNGGTGVALTDPNADRIMFWDDSAGVVAFLTPAANLSISGTTIDLAASVQLGADGTDGVFALYSEQGVTDYMTTFQPGTQTQNVTYTLPNDDGASGQVLVTNGTGTLSWSSVSGAGGVTGTGTTNYVAYWDSPSSIAAEQYLSLSRGGTGTSLTDPNADQIMFWDDSAGNVAFLAPSSNLSISGTGVDLASAVTIGSSLQLGQNGTDGTLTLFSEQGATDYTTVFQPGTQTQNVTYTLPNDDGASGQVLVTNGTGTLSWSSVSGAGGVTGTGTTNYVAYWDSPSSIAAEQYLSPTRGGTGVGTFTPNGVLYGNGTGAVQVTAAGTSAQLLLANGSGVPTFVSMSSDATITNAGVLTIAADAVALGGDTTGNYVASVSTSATTGLTGGSAGSESAALSLAFDYTSTLVGNPSLAAGSAVFGTTGLIFEGTTADAFEGLLTLIDPTTDNTWTLPNVSGTVITTGNLSSITATGTIASGTWNGTVIGAQYGGTGAATLTPNGVLYGNGTGAVQVTAAGTSAQLLLANGSGVPTFVSMSSDATITNAGVLTIAADAVALGGDTTGNYVASVSNGSGITGGSVGSEGAALTLAIDLLDSADGAGSTSSNSGLEFQGAGSNELGLLQGCANNEVLSWNDTTSVWQCASVSGVGGVTGSGVSGQVAYWDGTSSIAGENQLSVSRGGTGLGTYVIGDILYASGAAALSRLADVATGNVLISGGVGIAPSWGKVDLMSHVTGTLSVANGGTGATTLADLITLSTHTTGNYVASVSNGSGITGGSAGSEGAALTLALGALTADWNQTGAFDIALGNASSELKIMESTGATYYGIFDVGDLSADRTLTVPNVSGVIATVDGAQTFTSATWNGTVIGAQYGGTGAATLTPNGVLYGNGTGAVQVTAAGTSAQLLLANGSGVPTFVSMSSDATITNAGVLTIAADAVALGGDTTGNYVASVSNGSGITGGSVGSEGAALTLAIDLLDSADGAGSTSSNSGLEFQGASSNELTLLQGCSDNNVLAWQDASNSWICTSVGGVGAGDITAVGDATTGDAFTAAGTSGTSLYFYDADGRGQLTIANLTAARTYTLPNVSGTIITTGDTGSVTSTMLADSTIAEADLSVTNAATAGYILSYDAGGGFTWIANTGGTGSSKWTDSGTITYLTSTTDDVALGGSTSTASRFFFDVTTGNQIIFEGTGADDANESTLVIANPTADNTLTIPNITGTFVTTGDTASVTGTMITNDTVVLTTDTAGNYVASVSNGSGITGGNGGSEGAALTLALGALTADWNQTGAFDIALNNASSELKIMESTGATYYGIFDVGDLSSDQTYSFTTGGTVWTSGNDGTGSTLDADTLDGHSATYFQTVLANPVTGTGTNGYNAYWNGTGMLGSEQYVATSRGGTGVNGSAAANGALLIGNSTGYSLATLTQGSGVTITNGSGTITIASTLGTSVDLASEVTGTLPVANGGTGATTLADLITLSTHTTGNYVASITNGSGITGGNGGSEGAALTLALSALTADWNQTGAFDIALNNASSELKIMESTGATYYGIFDVGDLASDQTYSFTTGGTVWTSGNDGSGSTLDADTLDGISSASFVQTSGLLFTAAGTSGSSQSINQGDTLTIAAGTGITTTGGVTDTITIASTLGTDISSSEIVDGTIAEADLNATNSPTAGYALIYDVGGGFTWADTGGMGNSKWTDAGTFTYLSGTADNIVVGASTESGAAFEVDTVNTTIKLKEGGTTPTYFGIFDVGDLSSDQTYSFTTGGTVWTSGNDGSGSTLDADTLDGISSASFVQTSGLLFTAAGTSGSSQSINQGDTLTIAAGTGITTTGGATDTITIASTLGTSVDLASEVTGTLPVANGGTGATTLADLITLSTHTTGNYVASVSNGSGITGGSAGSEGAALTLALGALTADWNQTGAFDIALNNASSELKILGSAGTYYGIFDVGALGSDQTYSFTTGGTVWTSGNDGSGSTLDADTLDGHDTAYFQTALTNPVTGTGTSGQVAYWDGTSSIAGENQLSASRGGTGINGATAANGTLLIGNGTGYTLATLTDGAGITVTEGAGTITIASTLGTSVDLASEVTGTLPVANGGTGATTLADLITLSTHTTGNYVASVSNGSGITGGSAGSEGAALTLALGALTADWNQTGAFDIALNNASSELKILGSAGTYYGIFDVGALGSDQTYSFTTGGTVWTSGNDGSGSTLDADTLDGISSASFVQTSGLLFTAAGTSGSSQSINQGDTLTIAAGTGITTTGGATDTVTIAATLGTDIASSEIVDSTIAEADLSVTNAATAGYILSYDAGGGFTWIANTGGTGSSKWTDSGTITYLTSTTDDVALGGSTSTASRFFFDVTTGNQIIFEGTGADDANESTLVIANPTADNTLTIPNITGTFVTTGDTASVTGTMITNDTVVLTTDTAGNYVASVSNGSGITGGNGGSEGAALTLALGALTADWNQTGAFDIALNNTSSELKILGSAGTYYGIFDVGALGSDQTYSFTTGGTVWTSGNDGSGSTLDADLLDGLSSASFVQTSGLLFTAAGTSGSSQSINQGDTLTIAAGTGVTTTGGATDTITIASTLGTSVDLASEVTGTLPVANGGTGATTLADLITLSTHTTGNYVASVSNGSGITGGSAGSEGAALTLALSALTADWNQTGAFDIALNNASSELKILESLGDTYYGIFDVGDLSADRTLTVPNVSGVIATLDGSQTFTSATWNGTAIGAQYGGTGLNTSASTGVPTISSGTWSVDTNYLSLAHGGTNASLTASNGGIVYSTASALSVLAANANSGLALVSGGAGAPTWFAPTVGSVIFAGANGALSSSNTQFFWDNTNNYLGIGDATPTNQFDLLSSSAAHNGIIITNTNAGNYNPIMQFELTENTPLFTLGIDDSDSDKFKITTGSDISGTSQFTIDSSGTTSIANLNLGATTFDADAGIVSWIDMPVTSSATAGTVESYTAQLDGNALLTVYGESDGAGSIQNSGVSIGNSTLQSGAKFAVTQALTTTTAGTMYGVYNSTTDTGIVTTGTDTTYGVYNTVTRTGATGGTISNYGEYISLTGDTGGTSINTGLYVTVTGADTNYAANFMGGNVGIGDSTPAALLTVGSGDLFQVNSSGQVAAGTWQGTVIGAQYGGTGAATLTPNGVLYGNGTGAVQVTAAGTSAQLLLANGSGVPTFVSMSSDATITNAGVLTIAADAVALGGDTTGNYVASVSNGSGITGGSAGSEGAALTLALGALTADWNQTGAFDIALGNASSELKIMESTGATYYGIFDVGDLSADRTLTVPNVSGVIATVDGAQTFTSATWNGTVIGAQYGGTGLNTSASTGVPTISSGTWSVSSSLGVTLGGTGTTTQFTPGSIVFAGASGVYSQDNANFFWDDTNNRLGIGTVSPSASLDIYGTSNALRLSYDSSNYATLSTASTGDLSITSSNTSEAAVVIGTGSAQDVSVQFDGASYDYFSGLDHTTGMYMVGPGFTVQGGNAALTIASTGNVGIGTGATAPTARLDVSLGSTSTTGATEYSVRNTLSDTGIVTTGTDTTYGVYNTVTRTGATGGTISNYGEYISLTGDTGGTSINTGLYVTVTGADTNYAANFMGGNVGIGDSTPAALLTVGSGDLFQVNSSGQVAAGTWQGTVIGAQYGGTGLNTSASTGVPTISSGTWSVNSALGVTTGGTGTTTQFTLGSIVFAGGSGVYNQDNANFFWDDTNNRLGIGTTTPNAGLDILKTTAQLRLSYDASNYTAFTVASDGSIMIDPSGSGNNVLTIGDGGATDQNVLFDGNTNDYYVGQDDTDDSLKVGLGSAVGTNTYLTVASGGNVTVNTGQLNASADGVVTKVNAGNCSDSTFATDTDGTLCVDSTSGSERLYFREGGAWNYIAKTGGFQIPNYETAPQDDLTAQAEGSLEQNTEDVSHYPEYLTDRMQPGELLIPYVDEYLSDGAVHGLYARFTDVKDAMFADERAEIAELKSSADSFLELYGRVDDIERGLSALIDPEDGEIALVKNSVADAQRSIVGLDGRMTVLESQVAALYEFYTSTELGSIVTKDVTGSVDLLDGSLTAQLVQAGLVKADLIEGVISGGIAIENADETSQTIGTAVICPIVTDTDSDGKDDCSGIDIADADAVADQDGTYVEVKTKAMIPMVNGSRVFTTFKDNPNAFSWIEKIKDEDGEYVGFKIRLDKAVTAKVKVDWLLVEQK